MKIEAIATVFIQFLSEILQKYLLLQDVIMSESRLLSISQAQPAPQFCSTPVPRTLSLLLLLQLPVSLRAAIMLPLSSDFELEEGRDYIFFIFSSSLISEFSTLHTLHIVGVQYNFVYLLKQQIPFSEQLLCAPFFSCSHLIFTPTLCNTVIVFFFFLQMRKVMIWRD